MAARVTSTQFFGARILKEIGNEEGSLEDILKELRTASNPRPSRTGIPALDDLWLQQGSNSKLNITGRTLPLLYHLITIFLSKLHGTVTLVDLDGRFSPSQLLKTLPRSELQHIHVFRPTQSNLKVTLKSIEKYMLHGNHGSKGREWVGTIVNGGTGGDINFGWRGWLRVEREEVGDFEWGVSVEEAIGDRERRWEVVKGKGWKAVCDGLGAEFKFG